MSEWLDNQKQSSSNIYKLLQKRIEKTNPRRKLTSEEEKRLAKLESIADKLERGENVQNRQLQTWLSKEERTCKRTKRGKPSLQRVWLYCWNVERLVG